MANTNLKHSSPQGGRLRSAVAITAILSLYSASAMADGGMASMCFFITYMKQIVGSVAVIAIFVWVMGYFEKKAVLADIGQYVVLGCMIAAMAGWFVSQAGLVPPSCSA